MFELFGIELNTPSHGKRTFLCRHFFLCLRFKFSQDEKKAMRLVLVENLLEKKLSKNAQICGKTWVIAFKKELHFFDKRKNKKKIFDLQQNNINKSLNNV